MNVLTNLLPYSTLLQLHQFDYLNVFFPITLKYTGYPVFTIVFAILLAIICDFLKIARVVFGKFHYSQ